MASFDIFRILIRLFKEDELDYESFCDSVDEFSSNPTEKYRLVDGLFKYVNNLDFYNFTDLSTLSAYGRDLLSSEITSYAQQYLSENKLSEEWDDNLDGDVESDED